MSLIADIYSALSSLAGGRVYPSFAPSDVSEPYIVYQVITAQHTRTLSPASNSERKSHYVQFDCWHSRALDAEALRDSVVTAIEASFACGAVTLRQWYEDEVTRHRFSADIVILT